MLVDPSNISDVTYTLNPLPYKLKSILYFVYNLKCLLGISLSAKIVEQRQQFSVSLYFEIICNLSGSADYIVRQNEQ